MDHAVHAADIHKSAVGSQGLDNALVVLTDLDVIPDLLALGSAFLIEDGADGAHHSAAGTVDLGDVQLDGGAHQLGHGPLRRMPV